jgi:cold shock CspA family protein
MQLTPAITFRRIADPRLLESAILERFAALEKYSSSIIGAHATLELADRRHRDGSRYHLRIELTVPGDVIVIARDGSLRPDLRARAVQRTRKRDEIDPGHRRAKVVIREAFEAARRRLQDYERHRQRAVKTHTPPPIGRVTELFPDRGYGFIEAPDGHTVYFQRASVLDQAFDGLAPGSRVAFAEEAGRKGPQASTVRLAKPRRERRERATRATARR